MTTDIPIVTQMIGPSQAVEPPTNPSTKPTPQSTGRAYCRQRGWDESVQAHFEIEFRQLSEGPALVYPTKPGGPKCRAKFVKPRPGKKNKWLPKIPVDHIFVDHKGLWESVAESGGVLRLAAGEPDMFTLYAAGYPNVTCTGLGEGKGKGKFAPKHVAALVSRGVTDVVLYPDLDEAGQDFAQTVYTALTAAGIAVWVYKLPAHLGKGGDCNALWQQCEFDRAAFRAALDACPQMTIEAEPDDPPRQKPLYQTDLPPGRLDDFNAFAIEVEQDAVRQWGLNPPNRGGYSQKIPCPFHQERTASADWNYQTHTLHCFGACGRTYSAKEVAAQLGHEAWEDYRGRLLPAARTQTTPRAPGAFGETRFADRALPITLSRYGNTISQKAAVASHDPFMLVWSQYQETGAYLLDGMWFSRGDWQKVTTLIGRGKANRDLLDTAFEQHVAVGTVETCVFLDTFLDDPSKLSKFPHVCDLTRKTPDTALYRFKPRDQQLAAFEAYYNPVLREWAYSDAPMDIDADLGGDDLTDDDLVRLNAYAAPVFEQHADPRARADERYAKARAYFDADMQRIREGRSKPIILEPREITSTRHYRAAAARAFVVFKGGEVKERADIARFVGCSMSSLPSVMDLAGIISIERTEVKPIRDLTPYEREHLLLGKKGENAILRAPFSAKLADQATDDERDAYADRRQQKRELAALRNSVKPDVNPKPKVTTAEPLADVLHGYSDPFRLAQVAYHVPVHIISEHGDITNQHTGVRYPSTPRNLWLALADELRPPVTDSGGIVSEEVTDMVTFIEATEPRDHAPVGEVEATPTYESVEPLDSASPPGVRLSGDESDSPDSAPMPLWAIQKITEDFARSHECEFCKQPAAGRTAFDNWRCEAHYFAPLESEAAR